MRRYMRVGLVHFMAYPQTIKGEGPILETLGRICRDDYFDAVEVTWIKDPALRREAARMLRAAQITVAYGAQPRLLTQGLNLNHLDPAQRRKAVDTVKEGIDEAYELGAVGVGFLSGPYDPARREEAFAALVESTGELCAYAKTLGEIKLAHEVFDYDVDKKSLVGPAPLAKRYAEAVRAEHDNFGLMVDLSHIPLLHETVAQSLEPVRDVVIHAHVGNCVAADSSRPGYGDNHPRFGFPGGENDVGEVTEYLKALLAIGYLNTHDPPILSFEVKPFGDEDPEIVIVNAKRTLNRAWARVRPA